MTTSRTGTASYKRWRRNVLRSAQAAGVTHCPICNVRLNYERGLLDESAEPDHITPHSLGGKNVIENGRVLCRRCNIRRGDGRRERKQARRTAAARRTVTTLVDW